MLRKITNRIAMTVWKLRRNRRNAALRKRVADKAVPTIFSCNCTGGVMYHDLGWPFLSPTVNLYMSCEDFIRFCENWEYYISLELQPYTGDIRRDYPLCTLGDLTLFMVHYRSFEEAKEKWEERSKRIRPDRIRIIATDRDGCTDALKARFEKLPYQKVMLVHRPDEEHPSCVYIRGFEADGQVGTVVEPDGRFTGKRYYDQFDWVRFLAE